MSLSQFYVLPDTLRNWPWQPITSEHYHSAQAESVAWLESFNPFSRKAQIAFNKCDFSLFSALCFPKSDHYNLRSCCDLMTAFFLLDEYTDPCDAAGAKAICDATEDAIRNPDKPRPAGENILGEICRQLWKRASIRASKACQERFVQSWADFLPSVVEQAARRSSSYICTIEEYMEARRLNIGSDPCIAFIEMSLGLDLPHDVREHPLMMSLTRDISDMIILSNDICSYKKEVLANDVDYNIITVVMKHNKLDLSGATKWISDLHDDIVGHFLSVRDDVLNKRGFPSYGEDLDRQIALFIDGIGQSIRGHDEWLFRSGRYFGSDGLNIQKTRVVYIERK